MFIRLRKSNLSLERAVYKPAQKDLDGNVLVHPVRTTEYLGSMNAHEKFSNVPPALLAKLDEGEKAELMEALKKNDPPQDFWLAHLPRQIERSASELKVCAGLLDGPDTRKALELRVKAIEAAWNAFFKVAQDSGLKRKVNRTKKPKTEGEKSTDVTTAQ
jgi:hypothetical protein